MAVGLRRNKNRNTAAFHASGSSRRLSFMADHFELRLSSRSALRHATQGMCCPNFPPASSCVLMACDHIGPASAAALNCLPTAEAMASSDPVLLSG
jgi:hypothetical protein